MNNHACCNQPDDSLWTGLNWYPTSRQLEQFITLQQLLNHFNKTVNLTRLLKGEDYWIGQVFDSLWPLQKELHRPQISLNCIDVGTGCGFPGLALAISLPKAKLTLVDSTRKKTSILKKITEELGLDARINILTERIEVTGQNDDHRGRFDLAMARAVADAPITAEYLIPLLKQGGEALLFRGKWNQIEKQNLIRALIMLKAEINKVQSLELPNKRGERHLIRLKAKSICPKLYPRAIGVPTKKPLGVQAVDNL